MEHPSGFGFWVLGCFASLLLLGLPVPGYAQDADQTIEDVVDVGDGMTDIEALDWLEGLRHAPLDLNTATRTDLEQLPWISPQQAAGIIQWRNRYGRFSDLEALRSVDGLDAETIDRLRPFLVARSAGLEVNGRWRTTRSRRMRDTAEGAGWMGVQADMGIGAHVGGGIRLESRDPVTALRWRGGYLEARRILWIEQAVVGHYSVEYGQGLVFGPSSRRRIDGLGAPIKWRARGVTPARSSRQRSPYKGVALVTRAHSLHLVALLARMPDGGRMRGWRTEWRRHSTTIGATVSDEAVGDHAPSDRTHRLREYGIDFDMLLGATNIFGEAVWRNEEYAGLTAGVHWTLGRMEGGTTLSGAAPPPGPAAGPPITPRDYRIATTVRFRPDRQTLLAVTHDTRPVAVRLFSPMTTTFTVRGQRRISRSVLAAGLWQKTNSQDTRSSVQTRIDWRPIRRLRLRGQIENRTYSPAGYASERERRLLTDIRYEAAERFVVSGQWTGAFGSTTEPTSAPPFEENLPDSDARTRWALYVRSPFAPGLDISIRYARTLIVQSTQRVTRRSDISWSIQVTGEW